MSTQTVIRKPSVQSLYIEMSIDGTKLSSGTAFVVDTAKGPHLITNRHNVTGRDQNTGQPLSPTAGIPNQINIWHNASSGLGAWQSCFVLLVAMALLLDAYMQWIHIGSYRLAARFSQRGGLVHPKGCADFGQKRSVTSLPDSSHLL